MKRRDFKGLFPLLAASIRREKVKILLWGLSLAAFTVGVGFAYPELFPDLEALRSMAEGMKNPAMVAMFGPVFDAENYTLAVAMSNQMLIFSMLLAAIMSILIVTGLTRRDEEEGIIELIQSLPVGRLSHSLAAFLIVVSMNIALGIMIGLGIWMIPEESFTLGGSMTFGAAVTVSGILMASLTLLVCQLFENNRTATGISFVLLGVMYVLRGIGDISDNALAWAVPFNWPLRAEVFVENMNLLNLATLGLALVIAPLALLLNAKRDTGTGILPQRAGKKGASKFLRTPSGIVLRLLRPSIIAWAAVLFVLGASYGSIFGDIDLFIQDHDIFDEMLPGGDYPLTVQFMTTIMMVVAITAGIGPIMFLSRLSGEEKRNHTEHIYARAVPRMKMFVLHSIVAIAGTALMLLFSSLGLYAGVYASMEDPFSMSLVLQAAFAYLPALLFMVALAALVVGYLPRMTYLVWIYFVYAFFATYIGTVIGLPDIMQDLTPFGHVDALPIDDFQILPAIVICLFAALLFIIGALGYRRRDLIG